MQDKQEEEVTLRNVVALQTQLVALARVKVARQEVQVVLSLHERQ